MRVLTGTAVFALIVCGAWAQSGLDGKEILMTGGQVTSVAVPVALPCDSKLAEGEVLRITHTKTGREIPATLRDGELVIVPEGAVPGSEHRFKIKVVQDNPPPKVNVAKREGQDVIDIAIEDVPFTAYNYSNDWKKPFLWPVLAEGGVKITRDYPMGEKELTEDHGHHKSLWSAFGAVNGVDCWAEGDGSGYQVSGEVTFGSGDAYGWVHAKNQWGDKDKKPVLSEEREYRFYAGKPDARLFDLTITFTADQQGDVLFKDTKEGGLISVRMRDQMTEKAGGGLITNSRGQKTMAECWGQPAEWCDYSGTVKDAGEFGITFFDNPQNLRYPSRWHVRDYGLHGANVFGLNDFTKGAENGDYTLKSGEKITFKYRAYIHTGNAEVAKVADRYADYVTPPAARWAE